VIAAVSGGPAGGGMRTVTVGGLDRAASRSLLAARLGHMLRPADLEAADALWHATDGLPGKLIAAATAAAKTGSGYGLPRPADVPDLLPSILGRLGPDELALLDVLALAPGTEVDTSLLGRLAGTPWPDDAALAHLVAAGLITVGDSGLRLPP